MLLCCYYFQSWTFRLYVNLLRYQEMTHSLTNFKTIIEFRSTLPVFTMLEYEVYSSYFNLS